MLWALLAGREEQPRKQLPLPKETPLCPPHGHISPPFSLDFFRHRLLESASLGKGTIQPGGSFAPRLSRKSTQHRAFVPSRLVLSKGPRDFCFILRCMRRLPGWHVPPPCSRAAATLAEELGSRRRACSDAAKTERETSPWQPLGPFSGTKDAAPYSAGCCFLPLPTCPAPHMVRI